MKARPFVPGQRWRYFALTLFLTGVIAALLIWANEDYLFHAKLYETGESAASSLGVLRAAHGHEIHGTDSHWGFHQPGPALFYGFALGEHIAFHWLRLTPTPFNAQVLAVIILLTSFFAAGLSVSARWVRSWLFLPLACTFAALHFTAVDGRLSWVSVSPAYILPLIFFALVVSAASVGAGQGDDLPLLALAGCFLCHLQVAQPLFVAPMFALAYVGLAWACWRRKSIPTPDVPSLSNATARPWRIYRKAHWLAAVIVGVFALPILADLLFVRLSNFSAILQHLRNYPAAAHRWEDCVQYLLHFGAYKPSLRHVAIYQGDASWPDVRHYALAHLKMSGFWLGALLTPLLALAVRVVWRRPAAVPLHALHPVPGRWRFLGWLAFCWAVSVALTLYWTRIRPGGMSYDNAWFNYAIYYLLALLAAGALADTIETLTRRTAQPLAWRTFVVLLCVALGGIQLTGHPARYRADDANDDASRLQANTVLAALADEKDNPRQPRVLLFPPDAWEAATGIAVLLERQGIKSYVTPDWKFIFGKDHAIEQWDAFLKTRKAGPDFSRIWHLIPAANGPVPLRWPLLKGYVLMPGGLDLDPAADGTITFAGEGRNADAFALQGWAVAGARDSSAESNAPAASFQFRAHPVPPDATVEMVIDADPAVDGDAPHPQRIVAHLNDNDLGTLHLESGMAADAKVVRIPASAWNRYSDAMLTLDFPDHYTRPDLTELTGQAVRAIVSRSITFRLAAPAVPGIPATDAVAPITPVPPANREPSITTAPAASATPDLSPMDLTATPTPSPEPTSPPEPSPQPETTPSN